MPYLSMPVNINQNHDSVANTRSYGCAVCCAADVASFYGNTTYTLADMRAHGVYTNTDATCYWGNVPNTYFSSNLVLILLIHLRVSIFPELNAKLIRTVL